MCWLGGGVRVMDMAVVNRYKTSFLGLLILHVVLQHRSSGIHKGAGVRQGTDRKE